MSSLLYPKKVTKKKNDTSRHYFNSTIKIKDNKHPLRSKKKLSSKKTTKGKVYKPKYKYESIFTSDLKTCYISGQKTNVEIHHIFNGPRKTFSEKYHFILPLSSDWHTQASYAIHRDRKLDLEYKIKCQDYWINSLHKTKEEWLNECGKWWTNADIAE